MNCPNCLTELPTNENYLFFACSKCNFLLFKHENKIKQVDELDIGEKYQQISRFQRWICSTIRKHEWSGEGYITAVYKAGCIKSRVCTRCFVSDRKVEKHEFVQEYLHESSCEVQSVCKKCGVQNSDKWASHLKSHSFSEWVADDKRPCIKTHVCKRCGFAEKKAEHQGKWINLGRTSAEKFSERRTCQVCGEQEYREGHWDSPWA